MAGEGEAGIAGFWAVVPAGGSGTRLWPLSRSDHPKFLHDLTGSGQTLIQATVERVRTLCGERIVVVTGAGHAEAVLDQLPDVPRERVLAEPSPRDSMAAIAWAAAVIERVDPDAVIGSFAADHVIPDGERFRACVARAVEVAADDLVVTIGIEPTHPATGFGYIQVGHPLPGHAAAARVRQFVEKPDVARARAYLATGEFRWNAGMFVVRARVLLDLLARWHPELAAGVRAIAADRAELAATWPTLERIAIDHAIAEPAADIGRVAVVPGDFSWNDIGDFATLVDLLPEVAGLTVLGDPTAVVALESTGFVAPRGGRIVTVLGVDDVVVVDTPDAVLVTIRERAQDVKALVEALKDAGRDDVT